MLSRSSLNQSCIEVEGSLFILDLLEGGIMPRKCSVYGCRSGYKPKKKTKDKETEKVTVHCFLSDKEECQKWIDALPNANLKAENITQHVGVCAKHWPSGAPKINCRGK